MSTGTHRRRRREETRKQKSFNTARLYPFKNETEPINPLLQDVLCL